MDASDAYAPPTDAPAADLRLAIGPCPCCGGADWQGGRVTGYGTLHWRPDGMSWIRRMFSHGQRIGSGGFLSRAHVLGVRCVSCGAVVAMAQRR